MSTKKAVINASPFILLSKCGLIDLLAGLFDEIAMPLAVVDEISAGDDIASKNLRELQKSWLNLISVEIAKEVEIWNLGNGETEVLSFASARKSELVALLDDRAARRCADTLGIKTLGTAGLLVLAKQRNLISNAAVELRRLESAGLYLSDEVRAAILNQSGESE